MYEAGRLADVSVKIWIIGMLLCLLKVLHCVRSLSIHPWVCKFNLLSFFPVYVPFFQPLRKNMRLYCCVESLYRQKHFRAIQLVTLSYNARVFIGGTQGALPLDPARDFVP